jgi:hypothetical protein
MRNIVVAATLSAIALGGSQGKADEKIRGECLLEVSGVKSIDGKCDIRLSPGGSFQVSSIGKDLHFAIVNLDDDKRVATANWNGVVPESRAHEQLGQMTRTGACWRNAEARICAWRMGTRPRVSPLIRRGHLSPRITYSHR